MGAFAGAYLVLYGLVAVLLAAHGAYYLAAVLRRRAPQGLGWHAGEAPLVTVQVPLYNEGTLAERMLDALARLDWPRDRLEVQLLDDSDDGSERALAALAASWRARGLDVRHLHGARRDFKAGALQRGLDQARGEFVATFDVDFVPPPDFLRRALAAFGAPRVACVQARWAHLNEDANALTRALALGLDAHFLVEQRARSDAGGVLSFSGTAALWRAEALRDCGGWPGETLAEDLDLSLVAFGRGWRFRQIDLAVPQELPAEVETFRRQQARWARGSIQCARKHLAPLLRAPAPLALRVEAAFHVLHYSIHPLVLVLFGLLLAAPLAGPHPRWMDALVAFSVVGPVAMFVVAARRTRWSRLWHLPMLLLVGVGICWSSTRAILGGLARRGGFDRTPKAGAARAARPGVRWPEAFLAFVSVAAAPLLWAGAGAWAAVNAVLFALAFSLVAFAPQPRDAAAASPVPAAR